MEEDGVSLGSETRAAGRLEVEGFLVTRGMSRKEVTQLLLDRDRHRETENSKKSRNHPK